MVAGTVRGRSATEVQLSLPADPASVGHARRAAAQLLTAVGAQEDVIDATVLLVSEVVTNAVLHAGTDIGFSCRASAQGACIEVADRSPVRPAVRHHGDEATTGRGLFLVDAMATRSGVEIDAGGKVLWFVIGDYDTGDVRPPAAQHEEDTFEVTFLDLHVEMVRSTLNYGEAVLRELALLAVAEGAQDESPAGTDTWRAPQFSLAPLLDALDAASAAGKTSIDLTVEFPRSAAERCLDRLALVDEGDQLAREGKLLTIPAVPEVAHCRRWVYRQISAQADGASPEAWVETGLLPPVGASVELTDADIAALDADTAVVVADDGNRIVFLNAHASRLLGWESDELVGARLTTIIPPEQRLAHLAGFARHQATGETRLLGRTTVVSVQRADGSTMPVELQLEAVTTHSDSRVFRGTLRPVESDVASSPDQPSEQGDPEATDSDGTATTPESGHESR